MNEFRLLSTSGILGYGFPEASLMAGKERKPDAIGVDGYGAQQHAPLLDAEVPL